MECGSTSSGASGEAGSFLYAARMVEMKRDGKTVYARTLRRGEEDTGEGVHVGKGERLTIPKGEMVIDSRDVDEYHNPVGVGGYRPIANTVWAWHQFATEQLGFFLFFFALARRIDAAHALWASAIEARDSARERRGGVAARQAHFAALGAAEMTIIALGRCYRMVNGLIEKFCPKNTVWAWHQFATEQLGFFLFFFALARRIDAAHALWASAIEARDSARERRGGVAARQAHFAALGAAEMTIIALGRCYRMVNGLIEKFCPGDKLSVPDSVAETNAAVKAMRDAFEHIDERAEGKVKIGELHPEALTIFDQPDFVASSMLRYRQHELDFESQVIRALVDCRELLMDAVDARATQRGKSMDSGGLQNER